jgi:hypothetical protein
VDAFGDDDAQDDGAVLSCVGPPPASVTPSRFALTSLSFGLEAVPPVLSCLGCGHSSTGFGKLV